MSLDKLSITLYDILAYLLPGSVVLVGLSVLEATFCKTHLLALSHIATYILLSVIAAYFLGSICHSVGSLLKSKCYRWFTDNQQDRLNRAAYKRVKNEVIVSYDIQFEAEEKLDSLTLYQLADNYVVANGGSAERDILIAREGFYKASMVAFALLSVCVLSTLFVGGMKVHAAGSSPYKVGLPETVVIAVFLLTVCMIFRRSQIFYGRLKVNNALLTFLALRVRGSNTKQ